MDPVPNAQEQERKNRPASNAKVKGGVPFARCNFLIQAATLANTTGDRLSLQQQQQQQQQLQTRERDCRRPKEEEEEEEEGLVEAEHKVADQTAAILLAVGRNLGQHVTSVAEKHVLRLAPDLKRHLCRACKTVLVPGVTSSARLHRNGRMATACLVCEQQRNVCVFPRTSGPRFHKKKMNLKKNV